MEFTLVGNNVRARPLGLNASSAKRWRVVAMMVVENELLSPFLLELPVPVMSFHDLEERVARRQLS